MCVCVREREREREIESVSMKGCVYIGTSIIRVHTTACVCPRQFCHEFHKDFMHAIINL